MQIAIEMYIAKVEIYPRQQQRAKFIATNTESAWFFFERCNRRDVGAARRCILETQINAVKNALGASHESSESFVRAANRQ